MTEFGDRCDVFPRTMLVGCAPVETMFHHDGDGEHDGGRWYAVFEGSRAFLFDRARLRRARLCLFDDD
jgi:hypothetical protein